MSDTAHHGPILITGGTGFVGTQIRSALPNRQIRLLVRDKHADRALASTGVELVEGDITDAASLRGTMDGCDTVIHLVAIISEEGGATFDKVIRQGTVNVVEEAKRAGVRRFIDMSAMGARDDPRYPYLKAKWDGEQAVKSSGMAWTIFRPSVVFGPGDGFINVLADLVRKAPMIPVVGNGQSKFQPVAVGEVAAAFAKAVDDPSTIGQTFDLGGPDILTYEAMLDIIAAQLGKKKPKVHVPVGLMKLVVAASSPLPKALRPPVTSEQLRMLALDNCSRDSATARLIGRAPLRLADGIGYISAR
ncbi:MAG: complex I NDUFA9 subunit family protein [Thermomicrobiales bacterium]|nr:complex I NDUFA9 subunit family protein [Thermomicrobiales bacterium]